MPWACMAGRCMSLTSLVAASVSCAPSRGKGTQKDYAWRKIDTFNSFLFVVVVFGGLGGGGGEGSQSLFLPPCMNLLCVYVCVYMTSQS